MPLVCLPCSVLTLLLDAFARIAREEGPRAFYKGLVPSLFSSYHGFVQFASYEYVSTVAIRYLQHDRVVCTPAAFMR